MPSPQRIPLFVNPDAGTANDLTDALDSAASFDVRRTEPDRMDEEIRSAMDAGATRLGVAGGDGTLARVAAIVASTPVELAIIPAGTLNHFARSLEIPTDPATALTVAAGTSVRAADVGYVNDRLFLNTSSVGVYVTFVRTRERLERYLGYHIASLVAAVRILARLRTFVVEVEIDGERQRFDTPLVFIGVGERELTLPTLGGRKEGGQRGLHLMIVQGRTRARLAALAFAAAASGVRRLQRTPQFDSYIVERFSIAMRRRHGRIAVDGEIAAMDAPLEFRVARDALRVVAPSAREHV